MRLKEIAELVGAELIGDGEREVKKLSPLQSADCDSLTFLTNPKYKEQAIKSGALAILTNSREKFEEKILLIHKNPYAAWAKLLQIFYREKEFVKGIDTTAIVDKSSKIDESCHIGAYVVIGENCVVKEGAVIEPHCVIGDNCTIGENCHLHPRVVLYDNVELCKRVILHSGVVVGSDGFGYAEDEGKIRKVPQVGSVLIEDDVEIGANTTVDRGSLEKTVIGASSKIDNLCQIAHNVILGKNCVIIAQSGISGSTKLGDGVIMSGQSGSVGHIKIGSFSVIGAKSAVTKDVPEKSHYTGIPAQDHKKYLKEQAILRRIDKLYETLKKIKEIKDDRD
jgi:UDP-3-O-[3-hydroxymyristoyl] glucosamine N-acyltransferase